MPSFPFYRQLDAKDCGPACLRMIAKSYGKNYSIQTLRDRSHITRQGVSFMGISDAAESIGLKSIGVRLSWEQLKKEAPLPIIAHWQQKHFVVVYKIKKDTVYVADPALGKVSYSKAEFLRNWISGRTDDVDLGLCMILETTPSFFEFEDEKNKRRSFGFLLKYLSPHKKLFAQLFLGMFMGSVILLIFPFLTQAVVDIGINTKDINFIYLILLAQLVLIIGRTAIEFIRSWLLLHISTRVNVSLISDYLIKLMRLPISFFETRLTGDILQRIGDHRRIENFLTNSSMNIIFSAFNLVVFSVVLAIYNLKILLLFLIGSALYVGWIFIFLKKRKELDHKRFAKLSSNQNNIIQLVAGMQEIKLNTCEKPKRWDWERIQASLFRIRVNYLKLSQYQQVGSVFINETKNILISFMAAKAVIDMDMTLGVMFAVQYIIGQLNSPIDQLIGFVHSAQDAKISLERLSEVHQEKPEEEFEESKITSLPQRKKFSISNLIFQYEGPSSKKVLDGINLDIPENKVTAIVGVSGSGKTTLIKLLLGFYPPSEGEIILDDTSINLLSQQVYRSSCGVVLQDGYIFSDTIARNIALGDEFINKEKLSEAARIANMGDFLENLPLGFNTRVGSEGQGLSQGQKQRILIARAVYKEPSFLFFDEATNALDANNEMEIMENLQAYFHGRTVCIVAHRLSTVMSADQIVVIDKGKIIERGTHNELIKIKGSYFKLIKNQLELGL